MHFTLQIWNSNSNCQPQEQTEFMQKVYKPLYEKKTYKLDCQLLKY